MKEFTLPYSKKVGTLNSTPMTGGGGGEENISTTVFYVVSNTGFPDSGINAMGSFVYVKRMEVSADNIIYLPIDMLTSTQDGIQIFGNCEKHGNYTVGPIPTLKDYYLAFIPMSGIVISESSGGIAKEPVDCDGIYGYIITGDFEATFTLDTGEIA